LVLLFDVILISNMRSHNETSHKRGGHKRPQRSCPRRSQKVTEKVPQKVTEEVTEQLMMSPRRGHTDTRGQSHRISQVLTKGQRQ
jgi:hypothetical protein